MEVCVKIESPPGEAPKMYGRHFDHTDLLVSKVRLPSFIISALFLLFLIIYLFIPLFLIIYLFISNKTLTLIYKGCHFTLVYKFVSN